MGEITPAAQYGAQCRARRPVGQCGRDGVEVRTSAGADERGVGLEQGSEPQRRRAQRPEMVMHRGQSRVGQLMSECRLVPGDTHQPEPGRRDNRAGHLVDALRVAATGAPAGQAQLDADVQWTGRPAQRRGHQLHSAHGVHPAGELQVGVGVQLGGRPPQRGGVDELVGQDQPLHAEGPVDRGLTGGGHRHPVRPRVQLSRRQLGRHVGLAVGSQLDTVPAAPRGHRGQVVGQRRGAQHADGPERVRVEQRRRRRGDLGAGAAPPRRGDSLVRPVQRALGQAAHRSMVDRRVGGRGHLFI